MRIALLTMVVMLCTVASADGAIVITFDLSAKGLAETVESALGTKLAYRDEYVDGAFSIAATADLGAFGSPPLVRADDSGTGSITGWFFPGFGIQFTEVSPEFTGGTATFEGFTSFTLIKSGDADAGFTVTDSTDSSSVFSESFAEATKKFTFTSPLKEFELAHVSGAFKVSEVTALYSREASAVPEPASAMGLMFAGSVYLIRRRWAGAK